MNPGVIYTVAGLEAYSVQAHVSHDLYFWRPLYMNTYTYTHTYVGTCIHTRIHSYHVAKET